MQLLQNEFARFVNEKRQLYQANNGLLPIQNNDDLIDRSLSLLVSEMSVCFIYLFFRINYLLYIYSL